MSSFVKNITDAIETKLATVIPTFTKSKYVWSVANNNTKTSKNIFRVIPGAASSIEGTLRTITMSQKFTVFLTSTFGNKNSSDEILQDEIEAIYVALDLVTAEAYQRRFGTVRIMSVQAVELTEPEIDNENDNVSIGATYTINYRME